jgi:hypothetical protein
MTFFFSKLPNVSYEEFHKHWETVHADLTVGSNAFWNCKVQRYGTSDLFISARPRLIEEQFNFINRQK